MEHDQELPDIPPETRSVAFRRIRSEIEGLERSERQYLLTQMCHLNKTPTITTEYARNRIKEKKMPTIGKLAFIERESIVGRLERIHDSLTERWCSFRAENQHTPTPTLTSVAALQLSAELLASEVDDQMRRLAAVVAVLDTPPE